MIVHGEFPFLSHLRRFAPGDSFRGQVQPVEGRINQEARPMRLSTPCARSVTTGSLPVQPVVDRLARRVLGDAGAFLNLPFELFALAGDFVEIVIRKMTPLLLDLALELLPVSFDAIPIHCKLLWLGPATLGRRTLHSETSLGGVGSTVALAYRRKRRRRGDRTAAR